MDKVLFRENVFQIVDAIVHFREIAPLLRHSGRDAVVHQRLK